MCLIMTVTKRRYYYGTPADEYRSSHINQLVIGPLDICQAPRNSPMVAVNTMEMQWLGLELAPI